MTASKRSLKPTMLELREQINRFSGLLSPSEVRKVHSKFEHIGTRQGMAVTATTANEDSVGNFIAAN